MIRRCAASLLRWLRGRRPPPEDPYGYVRHPVRRGPPSRASGIALDEPRPRRLLSLFGTRLPGR
jgi:hypothetical protein